MKEQLQELRREKNLTQEDAAEIFGVKLSTYQKYERDAISPSYETLIKIADYYDVSTDYLLGRTRERDNDTTVFENYMMLPEDVRSALLELMKTMADSDGPISERQSVKTAIMDVFSALIDHIISAPFTSRD